MQTGSDTISLELKELNVSQLIYTSLIEVFKYSKKQNLSFSYELNHSNLIDGDSVQLERVFVNIIKNASESMSSGGEIWFRTKNVDKNHEKFVEVCIGNNGKLIDPKSIPKLFDLFYTKGKSRGTGLGLNICRKIVEGHKGEISCRSNEEIGVEFFILIPANEKNRVFEKERQLPIQVSDLQ